MVRLFCIPFIQWIVNFKDNVMRTENSDSEKDLNANPDSSLNTNKTRRPSQPERFPESQQAHGEIEKERRRQESAKDSDIELLANEVSGTVSSRDTSTDPEDIAGVADIDRRLKRRRR